MTLDDELKKLDKRALRYELFHALRQHQSDRAIAILEQQKANINWYSSFEKYSVLILSLIEDDPIVFKYLLSRKGLDLSAHDHEGHDILFWLEVDFGPRAFDYVAHFKLTNGSIAQQLGHRPKKKLEDLRPETPSLNIGFHYKMKATYEVLQKGEVFTYLGTHSEPAERGCDRFHDFGLENGMVKSVYWMPQNLKDSLAWFLDVDGDYARFPASILPLIKRLEYRAESVRTRAAESITPQLADSEYVIPILLKHAIRGHRENEFLNALCRLKKEALPYVENYEQLPANTPFGGCAWVLASMGSLKYLANYHDILKSDNNMQVRYAIAYIANIGDPSSKIHLEKIRDHSNYNVRIEVEDALKLF